MERGDFSKKVKSACSTVRSGNTFAVGKLFYFSIISMEISKGRTVI